MLRGRSNRHDCLQVPGGWAAQKFGGSITLPLAFVAWPAAVWMTPRDGQQTSQLVLARVCTGAAQGFIIPSIHTVLAQVSSDVSVKSLCACIVHSTIVSSSSPSNTHAELQISHHWTLTACVCAVDPTQRACQGGLADNFRHVPGICCCNGHAACPAGVPAKRAGSQCQNCV